MTLLPITQKDATKEEYHPTSTRTSIQSLLESRCYTCFILIIILIDFIMMGVLTCKLGETTIIVSQIMDIIIQGIFIMDCLLQMYCFRGKFFSDSWKILDLLTTIITSIPLGSFSKYSKFICSIRILRVIRLFSHFAYLRKIIDIIGKAIPQVAWTIVVQLVVFYCYAVIGTMLFGEQFQDWFGSIWLSLYSLFQIMTLESWSMGIARPVIAVFPFAWIYFVSFVIMSSFVLMNIVVGIIVNTIQDDTSIEILNCKDNEERVLKEFLLKLEKLESELRIVLNEKEDDDDNSKSGEVNMPAVTPVVTPVVIVE